MRQLRWLSFALCLLAAVASGAAEPPDGRAVLGRMKAWLEPTAPSTRRLAMTVRSAKGTVVEWKAAQARGIVDGNPFVLTVVLDPPDVRGTALLIEERAGQPNAEWLYVPYLRRVRQVLPVNEFESFLNTEFTDSDVGFIDLTDRKVTLLGEGQVNGVAAHQLLEVPADPRTFTRIVTWVAKDTGQPLKREYYDVADRLWKVETFEDVATVQGTPVAQHVRMEDVQTGYVSEYRISDVAVGVQIPGALFDWQQLAQAVDHPLWK